MDHFSISQMSRFSGIKPHTIRIWEKRYNAFEPYRTKGNTRYYSDTQLRRLLKITSLMNGDYKVSYLCSASDEKLYRLVLEHNKNNREKESPDYFVSQLIADGMSYDEAAFEKLFSHCLLRFGLKETYKKVIYPAMIRIGLLWSGNVLPPAHEHFITNLIRTKIQVATDSLPPAKPESDTWLLFLPEDEFHELGLLFSNWLTRFSGKKTIYLGANVPFSTLRNAVMDTQPDHLLLFLVHYDFTKDTQLYLDRLSSEFCNQDILVSGKKELVDELNIEKNVSLVETVEDLERKL